MTRPASQAIAVFDIDGVLRDVSGSYRRALADTVEAFTQGKYRPSVEEIDWLKREGCWNNDWEASQELVLRYFEGQGTARQEVALDYSSVVRFFQSRYRGPNPDNPDYWTGYIADEPILARRGYFESLTQSGVAWGFFSGATQGSARFILERRIGLSAPILVAMEDAPGKPDPTGLFSVAESLFNQHQLAAPTPVVYVGDTVADMQTAVAAAQQRCDRIWLGVGVLPPHVRQQGTAYAADYAQALRQAGGIAVLDEVEQLTPDRIWALVSAAVTDEGH
ncbi:TIGR01548 family HAD-type hydrolase [Pseudanabaena sp. FACHB-2040]|uniref:TIGR01548 family HAD-type hydrolase n=1 Tax=Pseudanabaena sp. FACHB-2040 TaxID=2692859 RepID=UPI001684088C|nr:TIGR01548 family HAD-type hydrolase [Pseudanabaena sp. FACHB-2040]MBD2258914.1 TIGR01548 family HAD-type hydrolase [Pseudanabaena sp. FACHB-2040]